ncbi:PD-(D/E)XK nuclease family protein [Rhizobium sp. WSM1274]|uniref:PD-(D/E)XK nuclease family protein n=1 Tax=Rhizobium sp. WSM1274 TaxID=3138254 RepID=UPI0021A54B77|nr:PD-(D/E)XK nuclease family protein [Rhizobium leguminosarum]UWU28864.1 PD-(D/E)XK nuclease family protein [Rhizobium leguminosarum bv. viciae]
MRLSPVQTRSPATGAERPITTDLLAATFLVPHAPPYPLEDVLQDFVAPWSSSYRMAPEEVGQLVSFALRDLAVASPGLSVQSVDVSALPDGRARDHLAALKSLWVRMNDALPENLHVIRHILSCSKEDALEPLPIIGGPCHFESRAEADLRAHLSALFDTLPEPVTCNAAAGALGHVQRHLLDASFPAALDETLLAFCLRDPREEVAFAAARAQALVRAGYRPQDIGLLVPEDSAYLSALAPAFNRVGLPLSGLPVEPSLRDHPGEFLSNLLAVMRGPAPRLALASLCLSPLVPWSIDDGRIFANEYAEKGWSPAARAYGRRGAKIFDELHSVSSPAQLIARLYAIAAELVEAAMLVPRINALRPLLSDDSIDWGLLNRAAAPVALAPDSEKRFVEGVSIFGETALPWRPVRHLIVVGLAGANWPRPVASNPFFTESEIAQIEVAAGLRLPSRHRTLARRLELFRRQLCSATEGATLTASVRDLEGNPLAPATALSLIARALGAKNAKSLLKPPFTHDQTSRPLNGTVTSLANWKEENARAVLPHEGEVAIPSNPFMLRKSESGAVSLQSPSRLETLLVSPFAWLLGEMGAEDRTWSPETLDVLTLGSLIHGTLEGLFPEGAHDLDEATIRTGFSAAFEAAIARNAPWLASEGWVTERTNLAREALETALTWGRFLADNGAQIRQVETKLSGTYHFNLPIHGRADCLLDLPDGRVIVVDHKRSSSSSRRKRMEAGADLQVELYRRMIATTPDFAHLSPSYIITAYHCTLDGRLLTGPEGAGLKSARLVPGPIGAVADQIVAERISALSAGRLALNRASDAETFEKKLGIKAYGLENPLIAAFLIPDTSLEDADV